MTNEEIQIVWEKQVRKMIALGFNDEIKKSEGGYRMSVPKFEEQPEAYKGRFDLPLLIDPRIPLKKIHKLAGIHAAVDENIIVDMYKSPELPYVIWTHDANRYRHLSVREVMTKMQSDETACSQLEVSSLFIHYPEVFADHGVDATGSMYGADSVPCINTFFGKPELSHGGFDHPDNRWGALTKGTYIKFLDKGY